MQYVIGCFWHPIAVSLILTERKFWIMGTFISLLRVENTKLWKRFSTKLMVLILVAIIAGFCGLAKVQRDMSKDNGNSTVTSQSADADWKQGLKAENVKLRQSIDNAEKSKVFKEKSSLDSDRMQIAVNNYYIKNNVKPDTDMMTYYWDNVCTSGLWQFVALLVIIACSTLVAGEFSESTMKTMITRPYKRRQILSAKLLVMIGYTLFLTVVSYIVVLVSAAVFFGTDGANLNVPMWISGKLYAVPGFAASLLTFGLYFLSTLVYTVFAFAISAVTRSRAVATGLSIFLMFGGSFTKLLSLNFNWGKYIFFADTNFEAFVLNGAPFYDITLSLALVICAVYCAVFLFISYFTFEKRDIS